MTDPRKLRIPGMRKPAGAETIDGWAVWHPQLGLTLNVCGSRQAAREEAGNMHGNGGWREANRIGYRVLHVSVSTKPK